MVAGAGRRQGGRGRPERRRGGRHRGQDQGPGPGRPCAAMGSAGTGRLRWPGGLDRGQCGSRRHPGQQHRRPSPHALVGPAGGSVARAVRRHGAVRHQADRPRAARHAGTALGTNHHQHLVGRDRADSQPGHLERAAHVAGGLVQDAGARSGQGRHHIEHRAAGSHRNRPHHLPGRSPRKTRGPQR
ncbi:hypothetical protein D3C72_1582580 [compost metagenome]